MLRIKYLKGEPDTVKIVDIGSGGTFKTQHGESPYMVVALDDRVTLKGNQIPVVSLSTGRMHLFPPDHPVVELDGTLELSRVVIQGSR